MTLYRAFLSNYLAPQIHSCEKSFLKAGTDGVWTEEVCGLEVCGQISVWTGGVWTGGVWTEGDCPNWDLTVHISLYFAYFIA